MPVDGTWSRWTEWGVCSATCGEGIRSRTRECGFEIANAPLGKPCDGNANETSACVNVTTCPGISYKKNHMTLILQL